MRITLFPALLLALACGDKRAISRDASVAMSKEQALAAPAATPAPLQRAGVPPSAYWAAQKLIRSAELHIQVRDVPAALRAADSIAQSRHALVADSRTTQDGDGKRTAEVLLRVPSEGFSALLQELDLPR